MLQHKNLKATLSVADMCTNHCADKLRFVITRVYAVECEVLEWNTYTVEVEASSMSEAKLRVEVEGAVTFNSLDVSYGTSDCVAKITQRNATCKG